MNLKNKQQTEPVKTSSSINIHTIDMEVWAREVKAQMIAVLNKRKTPRETEESS